MKPNFKQNHYSTEEQIIGTWFGKPLYRRCFSGTFPEMSRIQLTNTTNIEKLIHSKGLMIKNGIGFEIGKSTMVDSTLQITRAFIMANNIFLDLSEAVYNHEYELCMEYTKITD